MNVFVVLLALLSFSSVAVTYSLPRDGGRVIGHDELHQVREGETFVQLAEDYRIGLVHLRDANNGIDPYLLPVGHNLLIPRQLILPDVPREGIVVNLAELRLYLFRPEAGEVDIFPIGIGRIGRETPEMLTRISQMRENPTWTPTQRTREEYEARGEVLPKVVPAGPNNPLGTHAMRLAYGSGEYLIHGTNQNFGIGMRVSAGCIRLYPDDVKYVFSQVKRGTSVRIINQPVKFAQEHDGRLVFEVHRPLNRSEADKYEATNLELPLDALRFVSQPEVDSALVRQVLKAQRGVTTMIGIKPTAL